MDFEGVNLFAVWLLVSLSPPAIFGKVRRSGRVQVIVGDETSNRYGNKKDQDAEFTHDFLSQITEMKKEKLLNIEGNNIAVPEKY